MATSRQRKLIDRPLEPRVVAAQPLQPRKVESSWTAFGVLPQRVSKAQSFGRMCGLCKRLKEESSASSRLCVQQDSEDISRGWRCDDGDSQVIDVFVRGNRYILPLDRSKTDNN